MRRLLILVSVAFGCAKPPSPQMETVPPPPTTVPEQVAEPVPEPARCASLETCLAMVGDVEIPYAKFAAVYDLKVEKYTSRGREIPASSARRYRKSISERLIHHEMIAQEASARGVEYDAEELSELEIGQKRGIRDWSKHLARRGETDASLRDMHVAKLLEIAILESEGKLEVTAEEVREDYEKIRLNWRSDKRRVRASHILVPLQPAGIDREIKPTHAQKKRWEAEAKAKAQAIYDEVTQPGGDFEATAKEKSSGPSARDGGDIGIFPADRMAREFSRTAFRMKVGQISTPVRTKFGYHVIKLTGDWPPGDLPVEALEDKLRHTLRQRKIHAGRRSLRERLEAAYEVLDNMKPTLELEPERRRERETTPGGSDAMPPMARRPGATADRDG